MRSIRLVPPKAAAFFGRPSNSSRQGASAATWVAGRGSSRDAGPQGDPAPTGPGIGARAALSRRVFNDAADVHCTNSTPSGLSTPPKAVIAQISETQRFHAPWRPTRAERSPAKSQSRIPMAVTKPVAQCGRAGCAAIISRPSHPSAVTNGAGVESPTVSNSHSSREARS